MTIRDYLRQFLEHLEIEKNRSPRTVQNYQFYLEKFLDFARLNGGQAKIKNPKDLNLEVVRQFRLWLHRQKSRRKQEIKVSTQNYHLIALRSFLKYLAKRDIKTLTAEKIELAKMPRRQIAFLEGGDLERLLNAPLQSNAGTSAHWRGHVGANNYLPLHLRDKAILELLFSTGLRVSELTNLKKDDINPAPFNRFSKTPELQSTQERCGINLGKNEFTVRGKGGKWRVVFLSNQAKYWLKKYLEKRRDFNPYLFIPCDRAHEQRTRLALNRAEGNKEQGTKDKKDRWEKLTPRSVQRLIEKYAKMAGLTKNITPHVLRHSFATDLLQNGADIRSVQEMLGHSSITTTQIYTHLTDKGLREVHQAFHGRRRQR